MNQEYELMVVLNPSLGKDEHSDTRSRITGFITGNGGEITIEEEWGNRRLAYSIRASGQTYLEGYYVLTRFKTDTSVVKEIEGNLRLLENVLRFLLVKGQPGVLHGSPSVSTSEVAVKTESTEIKTPTVEVGESETVVESNDVEVKAESTEVETPVTEVNESETVAESTEVDDPAAEASEADPVSESSEVEEAAKSVKDKG